MCAFVFASEFICTPAQNTEDIIQLHSKSQVDMNNK